MAGAPPALRDGVRDFLAESYQRVRAEGEVHVTVRALEDWIGQLVALEREVVKEDVERVVAEWIFEQRAPKTKSASKVP